MLRAEFDPAASVMLAVLDDENPWQPRQPTGAPRTPGVEPVVLPLRTRWPDPFVADLPELLGPMLLEHDAQAGTLTQTYPAAIYSPEAVRSARRLALDRAARDALTGSDWAIVRQLETGKAAPAVVSQHRAAIRAWHEATVDALAAAPLGELVDAERWQLPQHLLQDVER